MASLRCRATARLIAAVALGIAGAACSLRPPVPDPGIALPAGAGRDVLLRACVNCHDLGGLELFASFYTRADWHEMLETMVAHGAVLGADELELVADYLDEHFSANR